MMGRRILVTGGRDNYDYETMETAIRDYVTREDVLVHGDAAGADRLCAHIAHCYNIETEAHPADWGQHGKAAGGIRNQKMLDSGVDLALVFRGGYGTADMYRRLDAAEITLIDHRHMYRNR